AWWLSHLELDWADTAFRSFWESVGDGRKLVLYDRPGVGLSDRDLRPEQLTLESEVALLGAVLDELALERVTLLGASSGGCAWLGQRYGQGVGADLGHVRAPTVVVHRRGDRAIPYAQGRALAAAIPGATLVPLDGSAHFPWAGDAGAVARALRGFLWPYAPAD